MKKSVLFIALLFAIATNAQILNPVQWKTKVIQKSETELELHFNATIENEWHVYSQFTPEGGALPLEFEFADEKGNYQRIGGVKEGPYKKTYNDVFGVEEYYFAKTAHFTQLVKIINPNVKTITGELFYQACKEQCIQGDYKFSFAVPKTPITEAKSTEKLSTEIAPTTTEKKIIETAEDTLQNHQKTIKKEEEEKETIVLPEKKEKKGLLSIFVLAFLGGLAALLTPCVFPMIPLTVSFFTKQSGTREKGIMNALFYGFSIIVIYVGLGSLIVGIFGADSLNALSTSVLFNVIFFLILVFFAASFLGAFEIVLPQSWANKVDAQAGKSGIIAIFFMALALAIVSFSCTGPIVGTLLVESSSKGGIAPIIGMLGFSSAIALPFMLFALFPGWLNTLPKSGGWMNTVKVSLGFLELAMAFKFLSNADLVVQAHLLEREVFLVIWIVIFGAWAVYLFGKITLPHDSPIAYISVGRLFLALFISMFTIYLIPGLWGAPLKLISGFPPPMTYSESPYGLGNSKNVGLVKSHENNLPENAHEGPHGVIAFHDYEIGLAFAKKVNKPILLDFTGYACVNCRKMEDYVWSSPAILEILRDKVVLISLYVDAKEELPKEAQYISKETGKKIETVGNKWSDYQITRYKNNAQPLYIVLDKNGNDLNQPIGYTPDVDTYKNWLNEGIAKFKK